jgi:hypothetical protein
VDLTLHPDVADDIRALPDDPARRAAIQAIADVRRGVRVGIPLDHHGETGDLRDCRKVYFDSAGTGQKPRFRLVYLVTDGDVEVLAAEVIAVGHRSGLGAYHSAAVRLGRSAPPPDEDEAL